MQLQNSSAEKKKDKSGMNLTSNLSTSRSYMLRDNYNKANVTRPIDQKKYKNFA